MNINPHCTYDQWKRCRWGFDWREIAGEITGAVVEVGIGPLEISMLPYFMHLSTPIVGVDPNPDIAAKARAGLPGAQIIESAVYSASGLTLQLTNNSGSSGLVGQWQPTPASGGTFDVQTISFSEIDDGDIEILNIDCEGSEHYVLQGLTSRPRLIGIELWPEYPQAQWCEAWLLGNGYRPIFATGPTSETQIWKKCQI